MKKTIYVPAQVEIKKICNIVSECGIRDQSEYTYRLCDLDDDDVETVIDFLRDTGLRVISNKVSEYSYILSISNIKKFLV